VSRRLLGGALVAVLVLGLGVYGANSFVRVVQLKTEIETLERDVATLRVQSEKLTATVERLRNDPAFVEKLAREDLGLVREGETVLKFRSPGR
jgi:cell division protein FtsB